MTLRKQTMLAIWLAITGLIGILYLASSTILLHSLRKAETQHTYKIVKGVLNVVAQTQEDFRSRFTDWSAWNDTYTFIQNGNDHYIQSNLIAEQLAALQVNLVLFIHSSGEVVYGTSFDSETNKKGPIPAAFQSYLVSNSPLLQHPDLKSHRTGIVLLPEGPMMITSQPILTSTHEGPIRGTVIFGRYLNAAAIKKLARINRLPLVVYSFNEISLPSDFQLIRSLLTPKNPIVVRPLTKDVIAGYTLLTDIKGQPALLLRVDVPREIYNQSQSSLYYLLVSLLLIALLFGITAQLLLNKLVVFKHERQESEERYRAVVAQASEGILLVDASTKRILETNEAFQKLLGYQADHLLQLTLYDIIADTAENIDNNVQWIVSQKQHFLSERQYRCQDGAVIDVEVSVNLLVSSGKEVLCIVVRNITERKQAEEALRESERRLSWQACHDTLTGLVNRYEFEQQLESALGSARPGSQTHILLYLDLDQFKIVNDTCGHVAGDNLLRQVSNLLKIKLRKTDIVARLGGDEFGVLLHECPLEQGVRIANTIRQSIQDFCFKWQEKTFTIGVSIGLVEIQASSQSLASVLSAADAACYTAKNQGRNRVHVYQLDDLELAQQQGEMQWIARINQALVEGQFCLYYQPVVSLHPSGMVQEHYEVLLRLVEASGQVVPPMAFIPAAERYNLMSLIDRWVIRTLFTSLRQRYQKWPTSEAYLYTVNLSGASINDAEFIHFLYEQITLHQIPPTLIGFEVTETIAITHLDKVTQLMRQVKALGCYFALDNFGSGISSFAYLRNLPVDYLKINGDFIKDILDDPVDLAVVQAIQQIGQILEIQTIAEFVENKTILAKVKELGVDYAQGYEIGKPCPLHSMKFPEEDSLLP